MSYLLAAATFLIAASSFGALSGANRAEEVAKNLSLLPAVSIVSEKDLMLAGPGISRSILPAGTRYDGLRLLLRSGGRLFLLPQGGGATALIE